MSERILEVYRQHQSALSRYGTFLTAAAGACIALAVQQTNNDSLSWSHLPLGIACGFWAASFWIGCKGTIQRISAVGYNLQSMHVQLDMHEGRAPEHDAMNFIGKAGTLAKSESEGASRSMRLQFVYLVTGAAFFVLWHIIEMAGRIPPAPVPVLAPNAGWV